MAARMLTATLVLAGVLGGTAGCDRATRSEKTEIDLRFGLAYYDWDELDGIDPGTQRRSGADPMDRYRTARELFDRRKAGRITDRERYDAIRSYAESLRGWGAEEIKPDEYGRAWQEMLVLLDEVRAQAELLDREWAATAGRDVERRRAILEQFKSLWPDPGSRKYQWAEGERNKLLGR